MKNILVINGPNLNMLGSREKDIYGTTSLKDIEELCEAEGQKLGFSVKCFQSNDEAKIIEEIHNAKDNFAGIIINAAAFTHTSIAIMDALLAVKIPTIEVHISNIYKREEFRHKSYISKASEGIICGFGIEGYRLALQALQNIN